jgi:hypothetical protein
MAGAFIIFSRVSFGENSTTASCCEFFSVTAEVGGGRTTSAVSFDLSSSLGKIDQVQGYERENKKRSATKAGIT